MTESTEVNWTGIEYAEQAWDSLSEKVNRHIDFKIETQSLP